MPNKLQKGYTMLELTFVIVIISLLISAVYNGYSLIQTAKLRSIITESKDFINAVNLFEQTYGSLPGDFPTASNVWGANCDSTPSNCNGDGDGITRFTASSTNQNEALRAWQHLALAGMIKGKYNGVSTVAVFNLDQYNSPVSNYNNSAFWSFYYNYPYNPPDYEGQFIQLVNFYGQNIITPNNAYTIDAKIDDGLPRNGLVWAEGSLCTNDGTTPSTYNLGELNPYCWIKFVFRK
ncbi:prepilin-type N-terminal cleavage/methylation domain-containing protein [endosymbiont of Acanthamoeba sp. UWC8]|uniref:type II secretion system protein n=1 Tax=endosymbiont of Acanthamoeba sp. UWC8 TaxID=86106 RepID=UPI0004D0C2A5|nr:type II secretion system protein [endosymbiont of Acanthamoeba sp. UWC8]AIF81605.1 prepilin-type N-terminal cleavage/methylation domain-containing protein [endosymbiont of Acanthamoeba sp. UWC8]